MVDNIWVEPLIVLPLVKLFFYFCYEISHNDDVVQSLISKRSVLYHGRLTQMYFSFLC
jgi:hypothetical protein